MTRNTKEWIFATIAICTVAFSSFMAGKQLCYEDARLVGWKEATEFVKEKAEQIKKEKFGEYGSYDFYAGYSEGYIAGQRAEPVFIDAYAVSLPEKSINSIYLLERKGVERAVPVFYIGKDSKGTVTLHNCILQNGSQKAWEKHLKDLERLEQIRN